MTTVTSGSKGVNIRWLIRRDMVEVLEIESDSFEFAWNEEDFLCCLRQRNCIGMVAERDKEIVGFMVYELFEKKLKLVNFAVRRDCRRNGVGNRMVNRLIDKLSQQRRTSIVLEVRETNLDAQLFFNQAGFRAIEVLRDHYDDTEEDAYVMAYSVVPDVKTSQGFKPKNRISQFE